MRRNYICETRCLKLKREEEVLALERGGSEFQREKAEGTKELKEDEVLQWGIARLLYRVVVAGESGGVYILYKHVWREEHVAIEIFVEKKELRLRPKEDK